MEKGNIIVGNNSERHGIILAVRKDGTAAKIFDYGPDKELWLAPRKFTIEVSGRKQCYKCLGSGLYYYGGAVVNGKYTGKTGVCFGCEGKGEQDDADRVRCHYYWHRKVEDGEDIESPLESNPQQPLPEDKPESLIAAKRRQRREVAELNAIPTRPKIRSKKRDPRSTVVQPANELDKLRFDRCKGCGERHDPDTLCSV